MRKRTNWAYYIAGQAGVVPVAFGSPGSAKTTSCQALALASGRQFLSFVLQHHLPEDFGGFPVVRTIDANGQTWEMMRRIPDEKIVMARMAPSVILFDELTNAGQGVQAAALQLIQDGIPGCWMFAAANPVEMAASGVELALPMVNRLCILQWETDHETWDAGCRNGFQFEPPAVPLLPANWRGHCGTWGPLLSEFRQKRCELWSVMPPDLNSEPFPSPRSWTNAGTLCAAAESVKAGSGVRAELVHGCVGKGAGSEFLGWIQELDLPDPQDILDNPGDLHLPGRGDLAMAILGSVLNLVQENGGAATWEQGRAVLQVAWKQAQELAFAMDGKLWAVKPEGHAPEPRPALRELDALRVQLANA